MKYPRRDFDDRRQGWSSATVPQTARPPKQPARLPHLYATSWPPLTRRPTCISSSRTQRPRSCIALEASINSPHTRPDITPSLAVPSQSRSKLEHAVWPLRRATQPRCPDYILLRRRMRAEIPERAISNRLLASRSRLKPRGAR